MTKIKFEIWERFLDGKEVRSSHDYSWSTREGAEREISRRDQLTDVEYFIKEVFPGAKDPLGIRKKNKT
jgi:hypothetical protein